MSIKWGVIGAGGIADRRTIPEGIIPADNSELVAVMDVNENKAKEVAKKYGNIKYYSKEEDLVNNPDIDAIYIATPTYLHAKQTCLAAGSKKHVLCEKPMAMNVKECEEMIKVCNANNVKLSIGYMMRFHTYHKHLRKMIEEGELGRIVFGRAQLSCWYPPIEDAWRQNLQLGGGGSLIDMGSHCIDLLEMFIGKVSRVFCNTKSLVHNYSSEDTAVVLLEFQNGAQGVVDTCFNIPDNSSKNVLEIYGNKGSVLAKGTIGQMPGGEMITFIEKEKKDYNAKQEREFTSMEMKIELEPVNMYRAEIEHFSNCILNDEEPVITREDGLWNLKIVLACYESAKKGKLVRLS